MNEAEARQELEDFVPRSLFSIRKEVQGEFGPAKPIKRLFREWGRITKTGLRIDYVLIPQPKLLSAGWELGSIGVEVKAGDFSKPPDKRMGRILSQLFDYQAAKFKLAESMPVELSMIFLFVRPYHRFGGLPASIMMQEGIGLVKGELRRGDFALVHGNGMHPILTIKNGIVSYLRPRFGKATGSR